MKIANIRDLDVANGPGVRVTIFVSGCRHNCDGCFNKEYQDFNYGEIYNKNHKKKIFKYLENPVVTGLSILGGEPLQQDNNLLELLKEIKEKYPELPIWCWTGYKYEYIKELKILNYIDVLIDGRFEISKKDLNLLYSGSKNQRVIDIKQTKKCNKIITIDNYREKEKV